MNPMATFCLFLGLLLSTVQCNGSTHDIIKLAHGTRQLRAPADVPQSSATRPGTELPQVSATLPAVTRVGGIAAPSPSPRAGPPPTTDAADSANLGPCYKEAGVSYPHGIVIKSGVKTKEGCCRWCRKNPGCYSWYRDPGNKKCYLNANIPAKIYDGVSVGGSII